MTEKDGEATGFYPHQASIDAYGDHGFRFADMSHRGSVLCLPTGMFAWDVTDKAQLSLESLSKVLECSADLDVLLIGLGDDIAFLPADIREAFSARSVIVEAVGTGSAVRTYNVLMGENRAVGAALISVDLPKRR